MNAVVKRATLPKDKRILCISDMHGNLPWFKGLLEKCGYSPENDVLILVGDILGKGRHNLALLRYVIELSENGALYAVRGNCDGWNDEVDNDTNPDLDDKVRRYLSSSLHEGSEELLAQMCREAKIKLSPSMDMQETKRILREKFVPELDFLRGLPTILETEHYIFVHAGLPGTGPLETLDADKCEKTEGFMRSGLSFEKWVIVGHYPVMQYGESRCIANPVVDAKNRIVSIDGGCVVKEYGQLNALVIPHDGSDGFFEIIYDDFPVYRVSSAQQESQRSCFIRYGDNIVTVLTPGLDVSLCQHVRTGRRLEIPTDYLRGEGQIITCRDITDYELPLAEGDEVSLIEATPRGKLVKKDGVLGWYFGELS